MILFNSAMQREKIAVIGLVIIIVVALFAYLVATYDIFGNIFGKDNESNIDEGDYTIFDRYTTIQRNVTQNITYSLPADILEQQLLFLLRLVDANFSYSLSPYANETVYFDIEVVKVYNCSGEDHAFGDNDSNLTILWDDCADVNYISYYASNDTIFSTSYDDAVNKTGGTPLKVYVNKDIMTAAPDEYSDYFNPFYILISISYYGDSSYLSTPLAIKQGFLEALIGMKAGDEKITGNIAPENAYGIKLQVGDVLNFSSLYDFYGPMPDMSIIDIKENVIPPEYLGIGDEPTTMYVLRYQPYDIGETAPADGYTYVCWDNSSIVTKINETLLWIYTTPTTGINETFTWVEIYDNSTTGEQMITSFPVDTSYISTLTQDEIIVKHNPKIGDIITIETTVVGYEDYSDLTTYTVKKITNDKIYTKENLSEE